MAQSLRTLSALLLLSLLAACEGYLVKVDAHAEECFSEELTSGTTFSLTFEVAEGGFLDIDVSVMYMWHIVIQDTSSTNWNPSRHTLYKYYMKIC